jgi:hypothetical protein
MTSMPIHIYGNLAKWPFRPISVSCSKNYPRNITYMPVVIFFAVLDLERKFSFFKTPITGFSVSFLKEEHFDTVKIKRVARG